MGAWRALHEGWTPPNATLEGPQVVTLAPEDTPLTPPSLNDLMYAYFGGSSSLADAAYAYYLAAYTAGVTGSNIIGVGYAGIGSPEGVVTAAPRSLYRDATPSAPALYIKTSGTGNTGWEQATGGGGGAGVSSFNGRTGNVVPVAADDTDNSTITVVANKFKVPTGGITSNEILDGTIVNADINAAAAIAYSKLALTNSIVNADINATAAIAYSKLNLVGSIINTDVNAAAAIAYSKLNLTGSVVNADINAAAAIAYSKLALTGSIVNADIANAAAIAYAKLALTGSIVNADVANAAAIAYSKLALTNSVVNADIAAAAAIAYSKLNLTNSIVNADIGAAAAIVYSKLNLAASIVDADIANAAAIAFSKLAAPTADFSVNTHKVTNVVDPLNPQDAATKNYVDARVVSAIRTSDLARISTAVLADDTQLLVALVANATYLIEAFLVIDGPTGGDFQAGLTGPAASTLLYAVFGADTAATTSPYVLNGRSPVASGGRTVGTLGVGTQSFATLRGTARTAGTAGNLTLQWAQAVSTATNTTLFTDSWLTARRIA